MFKVVIAVLVFIAIFLYFNGAKNREVAAENKKKGQAFLANNSQQEGVESTASGLQYKVLIQGEGTQRPTAYDRVKVHYHGTLLDGKVFDSSVDRGKPISFGLNQVIKGWTEGLQLMAVGDKYRLFIPSGLAYGDRSAGDIGPGSVLIFDVELLGINE